MSALIMHESSMHTCGQPAHESFDPDGPEYGLEDAHCRACALKDSQDTSNDQPGTVWTVQARR